MYIFPLFLILMHIHKLLIYISIFTYIYSTNYDKRKHLYNTKSTYNCLICSATLEIFANMFCLLFCLHQ